jgi:hypothetical protein
MLVGSLPGSIAWGRRLAPSARLSRAGAPAALRHTIAAFRPHTATMPNTITFPPSSSRRRKGALDRWSGVMGRSGCRAT